MPHGEEETEEAVPRPAASASKDRPRHDAPLKPMLANYPRLPASSANRRSLGAVRCRSKWARLLHLPSTRKIKTGRTTKSYENLGNDFLGGGTGSNTNTAKQKVRHHKIHLVLDLVCALCHIIILSSILRVDHTLDNGYNNSLLLDNRRGG